MSQYKSLLCLNELAVDSLNILNLDLTNTNIVGLNTDRVPEDADPVNLYFTNTRFDTRLSSKSTDDIKEGKNLYYTDERFDNRIGTKSMDVLSDVAITGTPADNQLLIYSTGQWRNATSPFLRLDGTASMTGSINMGGQSITNVNLVDGVDVSALDTSVVKLTGNQTIAGTKSFTDKITTAAGKPIIIGRTRKGIGATGGLELYGDYGDNIGGAHMQAVTSQDNYPTFSLINTGHGGIFMAFDAYFGYGLWESSYASSSFAISKVLDNFRILYASATAVGDVVNWDFALDIDTTGLVSTKAIKANGLITAMAGIDMKNQSITNVNLLNTISVSSIITTTKFNITFDAQLATKTTADLKEGTNLYYTTARFDAQLTTKTTADLKEGTNLYYTTARFDAQLTTKTTADLKDGTNLYYTTARFDAQLTTKTTADLKEGTNLYYNSQSKY